MDGHEDDLWGMSDDELEGAFKEAQANKSSPDTTFEEEALADETHTDDGVDSDTDDGMEEFSDGSEQTGEDDTSSEDSESTEDSDEDEPTDSTEESTEESEVTAEDDKAEQVPQIHKFKANGRDYEFTSEELVKQFPQIFGQAMDYTKKMQTIKPWRKTIDAIEGAKLNHEDINLMIDVMKGDKDAIAEVLKRTGVDTLDLDTDGDSKYVAKDYGRDDNTLAIKDIVDEISRDPEYNITHNVLSKEWDDKSWSVISQNPEMIRLLHMDVKSGLYETLQPMAEKYKVYDGGKKSDLDYYKEAAKTHFNQVAQQDFLAKQKDTKSVQDAAAQAEQERLQKVKVQAQKRSDTQQASAKRKAAAPTKAAAGGNKVIDYLDTDEAFEDWYKKLQDNM